MKRGANMITYYWDENKRPKGWRDKLCHALVMARIIGVRDGWTIENEKNEVTGSFYHVIGPKMLVDALSWLTNLDPQTWFRKDKNQVRVETDEYGKIVKVEKI